MSLKHCSKWIVPTALALAVSTAWAGQITLYERPDFRGPSMVAVNPVDVVSRQGLGDTASSVVVTDGRWEVCTMEFFRGRCTELVPGNYPSLGVTLNGRIASAREVAYAPPRTVYVDPPRTVYVEPPRTAYVEPTPYARQPAVATFPIGRAYLYEDPNFSGAWVAVDRGIANDLDWAHFVNPTHRAASVRVESGNWLFCSDMAFQGECRVLGPGEYPDVVALGPLANGIRSARQVSSPEVGSVTLYRRY
jgi:hypothetical protein